MTNGFRLSPLQWSLLAFRLQEEVPNRLDMCLAAKLSNELLDFQLSEPARKVI